MLRIRVWRWDIYAGVNRQCRLAVWVASYRCWCIDLFRVWLLLDRSPRDLR
jgi:hypothetical protein